MSNKKSNDPMLLCADFETTSETQYNEEKETRVYLYHFRNLSENISVYGVNIEDFIEQLVNIGKREKQDIRCYFHNLSFDGSFILYYLYSNEYVYIDNPDKDEGRDLPNDSFCHIIDDFKNIIQIRLKINHVTIEFRDSLRNIPQSIKKLGLAFGLPKLDETHDYTEFKNYKSIEEVTEEEIKYITNDVRILVKAVKYMYAEDMTGLTFSSSSYANMKNNNRWFFKNFLNKPENEIVNEIIDESCKGGFTNYNKPYRNKILKDLISFDYNSLYPAVMLEDAMPYDEPILVENEKDMQKYPTYKLHIYRIYITYAQIKDYCIPFIGTKKNAFGCSYKYDEVLEDTFISLWEDEYNLFKRYYNGVYQVINIVCFKARRNMFKNFLMDKIEKKQEASHHINDLKKHEKEMDHEEYIEQKAKWEMKKIIAKLYMNGLSGKFGMRDERRTSVIVGYGNEGQLEFAPIDCETQYYYRAIYSKITSGGRARIISQIEENASRVVYWDTDSLYLLGKEIPKSMSGMIDDDIIGKLKYEGHYKRMKIIKAKCYIKELDDGTIKRSIAGATEEVKSTINFDNFEEGFTAKDSKLCLKRVRGGAILKSVDFTIGVVNDNVSFTKGEEF